MSLHPSIAKVLAPAYAPCQAFAGPCSTMRWIPAQNHVPRGFLGATGRLDEVELVLVFAEPGDPRFDELTTDLESAYRVVSEGFEKRSDLFHRNVCGILDACWPGLAFREQMKRVWMTQSVLCSAPKSTGPVSTRVAKECGSRYLIGQLGLFPSALVVAMGSKARDRLRQIGVTGFLDVSAAAPPGCNHKGARESWSRIPTELARRK